jgi:hypothetical protein
VRRDAAGIDPDAYEVLLELVREAEPSRAGHEAGGAAAAAGGQQQQQQQQGQQQQQQQEGQQQQQQQQQRLPPAIVRKALASPVLQNLARTLAYHKACLAQLPLDKAGVTELLEVVEDLSHTLRSVLCL